MLFDCSRIRVGDAYRKLAAKYLVLAKAPLREAGCMVEKGLQQAFHDKDFGYKLWRVAGAGGNGSKKIASDPVCVFLTYIPVEKPLYGSGGELEGFMCQGIKLRLMR
jgi:hypothetical protein